MFAALLDTSVLFPALLRDDAFLLERFHENEDLVLSALTEQVNAYRRPPQTVEELLDELGARHKLPDFVQAATLRLG